MDNEVLRWKCQYNHWWKDNQPIFKLGCGKYKDESWETTIDNMRKWNLIISDEEIQQAKQKWININK